MTTPENQCAPAPTIPDPSTTSRKRWRPIRPLPLIMYLILLASLVTTIYWLFIASDRYVSEASLIIRKTDSVAMQSLDISMLVGGIATANRTDQMLLREHLLSVDMLRKLDASLNLRAHYSEQKHDWVSRLWLQDIERFHRYYLSRTVIEYDDYVGVLRIRAQAYEPAMARAIADMLVREGEHYMNKLGHEMVKTQVDFLTTQVELAQRRVQDASQRLMAFQNIKGMISPQATAESTSGIITRLEEQRSQVQMQLASLPQNLDPDHPNLRTLRQSLAVIDQQIAKEKAKLADPAGKPLNATMDEFQRLQMDVTFTQEIYKAALTSLEKGRIDAARMLEKVSVMQAPSTPEYPLEPRRIYNAIVTLLVGLMLAGIVKLLHQIILDHVD